MRLWTLHPRHLDPIGLVALWREALLAQAVLSGRTRGYHHHPQLRRFLETADSTAAISSYLRAVHAEAARRGYRFDASRILGPPGTQRITETRGQLAYEWAHLGKKLERRNRVWLERHHAGVTATAHPVFRIIAGGVRDWERIAIDPSEENRRGSRDGTAKIENI
jgi:hypothetical protein